MLEWVPTPAAIFGYLKWENVKAWLGGREDVVNDPNGTIQLPAAVRIPFVDLDDVSSDLRLVLESLMIESFLPK
jgi:hypothetical protein